MNVTAYISTKDRVNQTLAMALMSIATQTTTPKEFILFMDGTFVDLRAIPLFAHIFHLFDKRGIDWKILPGENKGQVRNHQKAIQIAKYDLLWRLDDDNYAEADVLERLLARLNDDPKCGAVAGSVIDPTFKIPLNAPEASSDIIDIYISPNLQWKPAREGREILVEVDHLYSSFLFRKEAAKHGYCLDLSVVGHREETIFTHEMKRNGWKLLVDRDILTHHFRESSGGIRSYNDINFWDSDEAIFKKKLDEWGIVPKEKFWIVLDNGIGDHWMFKNIIEQVKEKHKDKKITIACCYPNVFEDIKGVHLTTIEVAFTVLGPTRCRELNVYEFCSKNGWKQSLIEAYKILYGV